MPIEIPVEMSQSKSTVPVMPVNGKSTVPVGTGCGAGDKRLEQLIKIEKEERIAADEDLQRQIDQIDIQFINITEVPDGVLSPSDLELINKNKVNRLCIYPVIYYLSVIDRNIRYYYCKTQSSIYNEIRVDTGTGEYHVVERLDPTLKNHIEDTTIHITQGERLFWNNKVSATTVDDSGDKRLLLTVDDIYGKLEESNKPAEGE